MGYRQRQRRRKRHAAQQAAQREARESGSSREKWWLTVCVVATACARCGAMLRAGVELVYRREPRESLCLPCAERDSDVRGSYRPSVQWERKRR